MRCRSLMHKSHRKQPIDLGGPKRCRSGTWHGGDASGWGSGEKMWGNGGVRGGISFLHKLERIIGYSNAICESKIEGCASKQDTSTYCRRQGAKSSIPQSDPSRCAENVNGTEKMMITV